MKPSFPPGTAARAASTTARPSNGSWPKTRLKRATERLNMKVKVMPDEAAFYGPKIDVKLVDAIGRLWQLSTVQFDFTLPRASISNTSPTTARSISR
jgi:threonyl-tRNA synthetase